VRRRALAWDSATILNNGPTDQKVDLVFLGDGYTPERWISIGRRAVLHRLSFQPAPVFEYKSFFNVHRVDVISEQSGTSNQCANSLVNTALDTGYYSTGMDCRLLWTYSSAKVFDAADSAPARDVILVMVNSEVYEGAAGFGQYGVFYPGRRGAPR